MTSPLRLRQFSRGGLVTFLRLRVSQYSPATLISPFASGLTRTKVDQARMFRLDRGLEV